MKTATSPKKLILPSSISTFARALERELGGEVYLVGGAVRDMLRGKKTTDIDIVVRCVKVRALTAWLRSRGSVNLVGRTFGVIKFTPRASTTTYDIALPRTEHSRSMTGGYKDFAVQSDANLPIEDDLARRDFTVNAIALRIKTGELIDPFSGQRDLRRKIIRAVGDPAIRFQEDYSRMARALRFCCQLGFTIEDTTWRTIIAMAHHINDRTGDIYTVPRETVAKELIKSFVHDPVTALDVFTATGMIDHLIPEVTAMNACAHPPEFHSEGNVYAHTRLALSVSRLARTKKKFPSAGTALGVFAILLHDIGKVPCFKTENRKGESVMNYEGHDRVGADMARAICARLALSSLDRSSAYHIDADDLGWLIDHHLLLLNSNPADMKARTIEKYFFDNPARGEALLALFYCDGSATLPPSGKADLSRLNALLRRISSIQKNRKTPLPPPLINGEVVMKLTGIAPSRQLGDILDALREEKLTGAITTVNQAKKWITTHYG